MNTLLNYFRLLLLSVSGILLLCTVFTSNPELANGITSGKVCWFHFSVSVFACCILFMELTNKKSRFTFSLPDALVLVLFGIVLLSYDRHLNLQPEKLIFISQIILLWFMLRSALQTHPDLKLFFISIIILTAIIQSIWAVNFLYSDSPSEHSLFKQISTGISSTFPFSGYLAVILPLCLNLILRFSNCRKSAWWKTRTQLFYLSSLGFILILIVLPGSMNRPAWIAATISCLWVCWMRLMGWQKTKRILKKHCKLFTTVSIVGFLFIAIIPELEKIAETGKTDGRMLLWNITTQAIMEHPVKGTGLGSFPVTYAKTQAAYFSSGMATESEKLTANCPNFAFNEYLHIGLEIGIIGLLFFCLWLAFSLYYGIINRQIGSAGGILSLGVLAMYSYPLQLPSFWVLLIFLSAICVVESRYSLNTSQRSFPYIGSVTAITACILFFAQTGTFHVYKEWKTLKTLYSNHSYDIAVKGYTCLYPQLCYQPDFLLEGAVCLRKNKEYEKAVAWLERGMLISAKPELYEEMARNKQIMEKYEEAEYYLLEITRMLPGYAYTYYLLAKLYSAPSFYHPEKLKSTAHCFLTMQIMADNDSDRLMKEDIYCLLYDTSPEKSIPNPSGN